MKKEKIILYKSTETVFTHNGIRVLKPLQCTINRNLVDYTYDLDMVYPIDDTGYWKDIIEDRIIKANGQLFRIVHTDKSVIDNSITIYAKHIFFDLQKNFIEDTNVVVKNGNIALAQLLGATSFQHNFTGYSDIAEQNNFRCVRQNVLDALLGDQDASFINRWGGEFDVDNFNIKMVNQVGSDKGYKIKYGRNLTGLNFRTDYTNIITRIRPIGFDGIDLGDNKYVDSPNINNYSMPIIREMKYEHVKWSGSPNYEAPDENDEDDNSVVFDDLELARAELRRLASLAFTSLEVDLPEINCEVNFIELSNTEEYSQFKNLEKISLGDIVTIEHKPLDINIKARCISYVYDCLKQQYESIEIGHYQKNFFRETLNTNEKMENNDFDISEEIQSVYAQAISKMTEMMNNSMNGYVVLTNSEILIMDSPNKKEAKNVWKFNSSGIAHSSTGYEGEYTVGMTMDGHINGALITAGTIKGDMLEVGTITTRELAVEIQTTINSAMTQETTQALITANLNQFESNLSQTFITEEEATKQIQDATEVAVEQATQSIISTSVQKAMESVNDQLDNKLSDFSTNTMNPALQQAMNQTLQNSKDYVVQVTGNYYTKSETDSKISQTREQIELGVSSKYETKENTSVKITEAIDGVTVGAINRVLGSAEEKNYNFTGISNETWNVYDCMPDFTDKDIVLSFEYDFNGTLENGSTLKFQPYYMSVSNTATYSPSLLILDSNGHKELNLKNQLFTAKTKISAIKQNFKFRFRADGVTGTFTVRKAQIKVGNKITEWSIAPEDIETNANNYTVQQLTNYYTKNQTDSQINIAKDEINLGVSSLNESLVEIETNVNNMQISGRNIHKNSAPSVIKGTEGWYLPDDGNLSLVDETSAPEGKAIKWVANIDGVTGFYNNDKSTQIAKGKRYSSSFWIKASRSMKLDCGCEKGGMKRVDVTTSWQKITHTFTANGNQYDAFVFYIANTSTTTKKGDTIYVHSIKLEEGDKPTEWSYAPEDISSSVSNAITTASNDATTKANNAYNNSKKYMDNTIVNYYTKTQTDSQIDIAKKSITSTVSETYATKLDIENMSIGGENLLPNSNFAYQLLKWGIHEPTSSSATGKSVGILNNGNGNTSWADATINTLQIIASNLPDRYGVMSDKIQLIANTEYVISGYCAGHRIGTIQINIRDMDNNSSNISTVNYKPVIGGNSLSKYYYFEHTFKTTSNKNYAVNLYGTNFGDNGHVWFANIKLEKGNKATSWSPCEEDYKLYANQTTTQISSELSDLSKIVSDNMGSDSITSAMKKKLISEYNDAIAVYDKLNSMYSALGDTSFNNLPTELNTAKNNLTTVISQLESSINEASESGLSNILDKFNIFYSLAEELTQAISNALAGMTKEVKTQVTQLADNYTISASRIENIGNQVNELSTHFVFSTNGLTIKSTANATKTVHLDNDSLDFMDNGTVVAQITDKQLLITDAEVKNRMRVGNILIKPSGIGGIMFIYE